MRSASAYAQGNESVTQRFDSLFFSPREIATSANYLIPRWLNATRRVPDRTDPSGLTLRDYIWEFRAFTKLSMRAIARGDYVPYPAKPAVLNVDRPRRFLRMTWNDRFLLGHLARLYTLSADPFLSDSLHSFRFGRAQPTALGTLRGFLDGRTESWLLRSDIASYADSMLHEVVRKDFVELTGASPLLRRYLDSALAYPYLEDGELRYWSRGVVTGTHLMLVAGNMYVRDLDFHFASVEGARYARYGDDILFVHADGRAVKEAHEHLVRELGARGLACNEQKTVRLRLAAPHRLADTEAGCVSRSTMVYLGATLNWRGDIGIAREKAGEVIGYVRDRIATVLRNAPRESGANLLELVCRGVGSALYRLRVTDTGRMRDVLGTVRTEGQLRALDRRVCELVIRSVTGRSFKKGFFRTYPPALLRRLGLPSFVHLRRIGVI